MEEYGNHKYITIIPKMKKTVTTKTTTNIMIIIEVPIIMQLRI